MTNLLERLGRDASTVSASEIQGPPKVKPIKWFAAFGAAYIALAVTTWAAWIVTGEAKATPQGPTPMPDWVRISAHLQEGLLCTLAVIVLYYFLFRPWRRTGHITFDGFLVLACALLWWQDPLGNYFAPVYTYNSVFLNFGSWSERIPGWQSPNGSLFPEPVLWSLPAYIAYIFCATVFCSNVMTYARRRWPRIGVIRLLALPLLLMITIDVTLEVGWLRLQNYTYAGGQSVLTPFSGHYYQIAWWDIVVLPLGFVMIGALRYFKDDRGLTIAERGIEELVATPRQKQAMRFLAIVGVSSLLYFVFTMGPMMFAGAHSSSWPADVQNKSYLTNGMCGPGTDYHCPGTKIPLHRPKSAHLDPNGQLVPAGR